MLNAEFTMCFKDVLTLSPDILDNLTLSTPSRTTAFRDMLTNKYLIREISGETIPEFQLFLEAKFNQYKAYYEELLDVYEAQINWQTGESLTISDITSGSKTSVYTPRSKIQVEDIEEPGVTTTETKYDLPRSASSENHPSQKLETTPTGSTTITRTTEGLAGTDTTADTTSGTLSRTSGRVNLVEQKKKAMELLRNVYSEFADKFNACFLDLYF